MAGRPGVWRHVLLLGVIAQLIHHKPHGRPDLDILVGANGRSEPEATDNRPEGRQGVSLHGRSRLSHRHRTIPVPAALDGNPYRRSNIEPSGPRYPFFGLLSRVRCFDAHRRVLQVPDF